MIIKNKKQERNKGTRKRIIEKNKMFKQSKNKDGSIEKDAKYDDIYLQKTQIDVK